MLFYYFIILSNRDFLLLRVVQHGSCLIEATFSVEESKVTRGDIIWYKYAVQQGQQIEELAMRYVCIPPDNTVKGTEIYDTFVCVLYLYYLYIVCNNSLFCCNFQNCTFMKAL